MDVFSPVVLELEGTGCIHIGSYGDQTLEKCENLKTSNLNKGGGDL